MLYCYSAKIIFRFRSYLASVLGGLLPKEALFQRNRSAAVGHRGGSHKSDCSESENASMKLLICDFQNGYKVLGRT